MPSLLPRADEQRELLLKEILSETSNSLRAYSITTTCTDTGGFLVGLGVKAYTAEFDKHFDVDSGKIHTILADDDIALSMKRLSLSRYDVLPTTIDPDLGRSSMTPSSCGTPSINTTVNTNSTILQYSQRHSRQERLEQWKEFFDAKKTQPASWCLKVRFITKLWSYVANDLQQYAASHCITERFEHVCMAPECGWHHAESPTRFSCDSRIQQLRPDMHLVVQRFIKPWTEPFDRAGMALVFNAGHVSIHRQVPLEETSQPSVFISHCWREDFGCFATTLAHAFDPETDIWVCSFAIWQHGDVSSQLGDLDACPFAIALQASKRVLVLTDHTVEALSRCWCVLEATFALKWNKPYDICLDQDQSSVLWNEVSSKVETLDLAQCFARHQQDKDAILAYAQRGEDGIEGLNRVVREVARKASERARIAAAAADGDLAVLKNADVTVMRHLRDARGRGILHMSAIRGQISSIMFVAQHMDGPDMDMPDNEGNSPLCVAARVGATAGVQGLLSLRALPEGNQSADNGLTPLHYAAMGGSTKVCLMLMNSGADVEAQGRYRATYGRRPLHIAAKEGHVEVTRLLVQRLADCNARASNGATVLWHAVHAGHTNVVVALVAAKADVNLPTVNQYKQTPLMGAVKQDNIALVSILLEALADINQVDGAALTCWDYCTNKGSFDADFIVELIIRARQRSNNGNHRCACTLS